MTVELRPMGVACNLGCIYCYQEPVRDAGNIRTKYDIDKMLEEADKTGQNFHMFGGEILLVPHADLEKFFQHGYAKHGRNGIQTNGSLIDDQHIEMFLKYKVHVGISIDGWKDLNDLRVDRKDKDSVEAARKMTQATLNNIVKCKNAGVGVGVIVTLHKVNGSKEKLPSLMRFIDWLADHGVRGGNLHTLEIDNPIMEAQYCLTQEDNAEAFIKLAEFFKDRPHLQWKPFTDMKNMMTGDINDVTCTWNGCDPFNTQSVYGIEGDGSLSNCGRTNKEGIDWYKADGNTYERYISLYNTPPEFGGCKGCPYFVMCSGSCPGEAMDGDFRNKTIHCHTNKAIFAHYEKEIREEGNVPITQKPEMKRLEEIMIEEMYRGVRPSMSKIFWRLRKEQSMTETQVEVRGE